MEIIFFCSLCSQITYFVLPAIIFKHSWAMKKCWEIFHVGSGKSWKSPGFFCQSRSGNPGFILAECSNLVSFRIRILSPPLNETFLSVAALQLFCKCSSMAIILVMYISTGKICPCAFYVKTIRFDIACSKCLIRSSFCCCELLMYSQLCKK